MVGMTLVRVMSPAMQSLVTSFSFFSRKLYCSKWASLTATLKWSTSQRTWSWNIHEKPQISLSLLARRFKEWAGSGWHWLKVGWVQPGGMWTSWCSNLQLQKQPWWPWSPPKPHCVLPPSCFSPEFVSSWLGRCLQEAGLGDSRSESCVLAKWEPTAGGKAQEDSVAANGGDVA